MKDIRLKTDNDPQGDVIYMNDNLDITVRFVAPTMMSDVTFGVVVKNHLQVPIFGVNNRFLPSEPLDRPIQRGRVTCRVERLPLTPGTYSLDLYLGTHGQNFDVVLDAVQFDVQPADVFGTGKLPPLCAGNVFWPATWRIRHDDDVRDTLDTSERP
jgi:hypothetical protein